MVLVTEVGVGTRAGFAAATACAVAAYLYWGLLLLPRGSPRLLAAVPVLITYAMLPLIFTWEKSSVTGTGLCFWFFTWLGTFKLLLLCWDKGPASEPWVLASYFRFTLVMHMPVHASRRGRVWKEEVASASWWHRLIASDTCFFLASRSLLKVLMLSAALPVFAYQSSLPLALLTVVQSVTIYLIISLVLEPQGAIWNALFGVQLEPYFDNPFAASSLEDFWGRRWNVVVSSILRETVYRPCLFFLSDGLGWVVVVESDGSRMPPGLVTGEGKHPHGSGTIASLRQRRRSDGDEAAEVHVEAASRAVPNKAARFSALLATFVASGIMHELCIFYMTSTWTGEMLAFFALHGVATGVEVACKPYVRKAVNIPTWLSVVFTLGFTFTTAIWLFFPPFISTGCDRRGISELNSLLRFG